MHLTDEQLNEYLRDQGLFFPIDPGANGPRTPNCSAAGFGLRY